MDSSVSISEMVVGFIFLAVILLIILFIVLKMVKNARHKYVGNTIMYNAGFFIANFLVALYANIFVVNSSLEIVGQDIITNYSLPEISVAPPLNIIFTSITDAFKAFAFSLSDNVTAYHHLDGGYYSAFYVIALVVSGLSFATLSFTALKFMFKSAYPKIKTNVSWFFKQIGNFFKQKSRDDSPRQRVYIFTEPGVNIAERLGSNLIFDKDKRRTHYVTFVVSRSALKTQEGQEFKDHLILNGFDVISENVSYTYLLTLLRRTHFKKRTRKVIFSMFYDDSKNIAFAKRVHDIVFRKEKGSSDYAKNSPARKIKFIELYDNYLSASYGYKEQDKEGSLKKAQETFFALYEYIHNYKNNYCSELKKLLIKDKDFNDLFNLYLNDKEAFNKQIEEYKNKLGINNGLRFYNSSTNDLNNLEVAKFNYIKLLNSVAQDYVDEISGLRVYISHQGFNYNYVYPFSQRTGGIIRTFSEYDIISNDFLLRTPITKFLDLKEAFNISHHENNSPMVNKPMHVHFIGFGNVNKELFKKMSSAYQIGNEDRDIITYHIVDINSEEIVRNLNLDYVNNDEHYIFNDINNVNISTTLDSIIEKVLSLVNDKDNKVHYDKNLLSDIRERTLKVLKDIQNGSYFDKKEIFKGALIGFELEIRKLLGIEDKLYFNKPHLYNIKEEMNGYDFESSNTLNSYIKKLFAEDPHFFSNSEFNLFIVAAGSADRNMRYAAHLRNAIGRYLEGDKNNVYIYLHVNESHLAESELIRDNTFNIDDEENVKNALRKDNKKLCPTIIFGGDKLIARYLKNMDDKVYNIAMQVHNLYDIDDTIAEKDKFEAIISNNAFLSSNWNFLSYAFKKASVSSVLQLRTKVELLMGRDAFSLDDFMIKFNEGEIEELLDRMNKDGVIKDNIMRMEHYRWCADNIRYGQLSINDFIENNNNFSNSVISTKDFTKTKNICMCDNASLRSIRGLILQRGGGHLDNETKKLVLKNDLDGLRQILYASGKIYITSIEAENNLETKEDIAK